MAREDIRVDRRETCSQRIKEVPEGFVRAYGDVSPGAPRFAGSVLAGCDDPDVPWHRIVRADGSLAQGRASAEASGGGGSPIQGSAGGHARGTHGVVKRFWWVAALAAAAAFRRRGEPGLGPGSTARVATFPMAGLAGDPAGGAGLLPRGPGRPAGRDHASPARAQRRPHGRAAGALRRRGRELRARQAVHARREGDRPHAARPLGGRDGAISFTVARRPSPSADTTARCKLPPLPPAAVDRFRSRPRPRGAGRAHHPPRRGAPRPANLPRAVLPQGQPAPDGPLITDNRGDLVWFKPVRRGTAVTDLKVQQLGGRHVLTWWEGRFALGWGYGAYQVFDPRYRAGRLDRARRTATAPTCTTCS